MSNPTSGIRFSIPVKINSHLCQFSPNGQFLASALSSRLDIYDLKKSEIVKVFGCLDPIELIKWSSDSCYILCGMFKRKIIQVWSLEKADWTCKIDEGSLGFINAFWSPDGRHILTVSEFHLRITVWSLVSKSVFYIKYVKPGNKNYAFSPNGIYFAVAERRDYKDYLSIFDCTTWVLLKTVKSESKDLNEILWSPDSQVICVVESPAESYNIFLYSVDERLLSSYSTKTEGLGVKSVAWSCTGQFLAIGGFDEKVRILNYITWAPIFEFELPTSISSSSVIVYKALEKKVSQEWFQENEFYSSWGRYTTIEERPLQIPVVQLDFNDSKFPPRLGVGNLQFSKCGRYLASVNDNMPRVVWIWDMRRQAISDVLIQSQNAESITWNPRCCKLAICTNTNVVYMWTPDSCMMLKAPFKEPILINQINWHPFEDILLLMGKGKMSLLYLS